MFDLIIRGGRIIEGSGNPWYFGNIGISGDRIAAIGKLDPASATKVIEAQGRVVCPGFIDMHTHSDLMLLAQPRHEPKVMQGVTTELLGLDGLSYAPLSPANLQQVRRYIASLDGNPDINWDWSSVGDFLSRFDRRVAVNVAFLVPHIALRLEVMGWADHPASAGEIDKMKQLMAEGMQQGAVGFSTGLDYFPARYSNTEELVEICKVVAEYGGISVWHMRTHDLGLIEAIREVLQVGEQTRVPVHISHFSTRGQEYRGKSGEMLALVDEARAKGIDVTFDSYPYLATSTMMTLLLPGWVHAGGPDAILERLGQAAIRERLCSELSSAPLKWEHLYITSISTEKNKVYQGKHLVEAATMAGKEVPAFILDLLLEESLEVSYLYVIGNEEDVQRIMRHPCHMAGSDGLLIGDKPNPRGWGTFPRYLGVYSRELNVLSLEETIRHITSSPAQRLGLTDRGLVKEGLTADLVVFDPQTIIDKATYSEPRQFPLGIDYVLVNGEIVVAKGKHTGVLAGRALPRCN